jgi:GxxExxY protein
MSQEEEYVDDDMEPDPKLNRITNAIIGAAIAVHRELGPGHLEAIYGRALAIEFAHRGIGFQKEVPVTLAYRGQVVGNGRLDFLVEGCVILELKSIESIGPVQRAQMLTYLRITHHKLGIILNFNVARLVDGIRRIAN